MAEPLDNPLLQQVQDHLESGMKPETRRMYESAVKAGWQSVLGGGPKGLMATLAKSRDPVVDAARGAISVMLILRKESKGNLPMEVAIPAATALMLRGLDFLGQAKITKVGAPELDKATHAFGDFFLARLGVTKAGMGQATQKIHQMLQDPNAVHKMQMSSGFVRHPMAATPTPGLEPASNAAPDRPSNGRGLINGGAR